MTELTLARRRTRSRSAAHSVIAVIAGVSAAAFAGCSSTEDDSSRGASNVADGGPEAGSGGAASAGGSSSAGGSPPDVPGCVSSDPAPRSGPVSAEDWYAADCDCTPERPCPMFCDGADLVPPPPGFEYCGSPRRPMCGTKDPGVELCAEGGSDAQECCGGFRRTTIGSCWIGATQRMIRSYFDAATGEQVGWEFLSGRSRVCGGIVPLACSFADEYGLRPEPSAAGTCPIPACPSPPCANNAPCSAAADCASGWCYVGYCRPVVTDTCSNGVLDGSETDVDCGGVCTPCPYLATCAQDGDCVSDNCTSPAYLCGRPQTIADAGPPDASTPDAASGPDASDAGGE